MFIREYNVLMESLHSTLEVQQVKPCAVLLRNFERSRESIKKGEKLKFLGVDLDEDGKTKDVYNPTPPFLLNGEVVMAARVEPRVYNPNITKPKICFFRNTTENTWIKIEQAPIFELEDPFMVEINREIILGGVEVSMSPGEDTTYRTIFNKGSTMDNFEQFAVGPEKMKDIRIIELPDGHVGVFTRPQGGLHGNGKICYIELDTLEDLKYPEKLEKAKIIELFSKDEWGGANQLHLLEDGRIGVIGHIASFDEKKSPEEEPDKNYYAMSFIFDPKTHTVSEMKIIATRANFPEGGSKKKNLKNVIFVGGIKKDSTGQWYLYAGLGDMEAGVLPIDYPF